MARENVYSLKEPIRQFKKGTDEVVGEITEVTISYKLKHLRSCSVKVGVSEEKEGAVLSMDMGQLIDLAGKMTGLLPSQLDDLSDEDQSHLISEANSFLLSRLGTGPSS